MKLLRSLPVVFLTALCLAQTATEYDSPTVLRVAGKLNCSCGCKLRMDCQMQPGCGVCKAARLKILDLQKQGKSERQIIDVFIAEEGPDVLAVPPGTLGTMAPYGALALGLGVVIFALRRYLGPKVAVAGAATPAENDELLNKYQDQIDKDLEKLD
jgi:cytochrome c-type biogenesis protein CcmH/NrfF